MASADPDQLSAALSKLTDNKAYDPDETTFVFRIRQSMLYLLDLLLSSSEPLEIISMGGKTQIAIKQMDLRNQPRNELIVNEIIVMKEGSHPNIVNFLDAFLQEGNNELWEIMEFMEGGALMYVIDNSPHITKAQISTICNEVCSFDAVHACANTLDFRIWTITQDFRE